MIEPQYLSKEDFEEFRKLITVAIFSTYTHRRRSYNFNNLPDPLKKDPANSVMEASSSSKGYSRYGLNIRVYRNNVEVHETIYLDRGFAGDLFTSPFNSGGDPDINLNVYLSSGTIKILYDFWLYAEVSHGGISPWSGTFNAHLASGVVYSNVDVHRTDPCQPGRPC